MIKEQCVYDCKLTALKQIQSNHKESLIEIRKLDKELQCLRLQIGCSLIKYLFIICEF